MSNDPKNKSGALAFIQDRLLDPDLSPEVRENTQRYFEHITRLDQDLRNVGMDGEKIDEHLLEIFEDYERELSASVKRVEMDMKDD
ncbi:MAG: hypothetical protein HKN28_10450 [Alphaproteobacteria bacterium]|nr:hypothetical protein [Alphaproteobacteria bacterium]